MTARKRFTKLCLLLVWLLPGATLSPALAQARDGMASSASVEAEPLALVTGQQKVLQAPGVTRIAIANPQVADVRVVSAGQVLVTALSAGATELTIWRGPRVKRHQVTVTRLDPRQLKAEVTRLLGDMEGVSVRSSGGKVYLEGQVLTLPDLERCEEITRLFPALRNLVKLDPSAHGHIAQALNKQLARAGLTGARAVVLGSTIFLEGMVDSEADLKKAAIITRGVGENIQSVLRVGASRMVALDVEFVEVGKNSLDRLGVQWPSDINGNLTLNYTRTFVLQGADQQAFAIGAAGDETSLGLALQFNDGVSRVLARPRLVTASRQEASFLAGGEIPIRIATNNRIYVEYKEYGVRLRITPIAEANGTIQTRVLTEISQLDASVSVDGLPGFLTRRVDTEVTVRDGETIILSGLLNMNEGKDITKVPVLGHIPIIGELFKSRQFRARQTELAVFVTPRLVDPMSTHLRELGQHMRQTYDQAQDDVGFDLFD